jgi:hypothetical protein
MCKLFYSYYFIYIIFLVCVTQHANLIKYDNNYHYYQQIFKRD